MARAAPAADRAVSIIAFLTANRSRGFTLSELVRHLGMNIASAHATLAVLCDYGMLLRDPVHRTYILGPALAATGYAVAEQHPAIEAAIDQADALAKELDVEVSVSAIAGRDVVLLARRGPVTAAEGIGYPGDRAPLLAPFGAVFLAWSDEEAIQEWLDRAEATGDLAEHYRDVLADIRNRGFSIPLQAITDPAVTKAMRRVRRDPANAKAEHKLTEVLHTAGEMVLSVDRLAASETVVYRTVAAPVFDPVGRVLLSLAISGSGTPEPLDRVLELGRRVSQAAAAATRKSRGRMPKPDAAAAGSAR